MKIKRLVKYLFLFLIISPGVESLANSQDSTSIDDIPTLQSAIEKVLASTNTPAVGIALVNTDGPYWIAGIGKANILDSIHANENTMFRIGSVSKMFVSLSILKLQEEGKLILDDKIRDLIPEIVFENQWEEEHPIRIVHLLEHTTGWDDYHVVEYAHNDSTPISLKEGLDFHPHSRISRWVPGNRMAYCNSGPPVAAYIVEKITGQLYEDYVKENFFNPLKMENATFLYDSVYQTLEATLYTSQLDPVDYWHIIQRPAGSINASAKEMANLVHFFLNRAAFDSMQIISPQSLARMEKSKSTSGAKVGLERGYGLSNYSSNHDEFVYRGHNGGVNGGLTELAYLPEYGIGHFFSINSGNGWAFSQISKLIRDFETRRLRIDSSTMESTYSGDISLQNGYYIPINPRNEASYFLLRFFQVYKFKKEEGFVTMSDILGNNKTKFIPLSETKFRTEKNDKISLVKTVDPLVGDVLHYEWQVLKQIPALLAFGQWVTVVFWIILMIISVFMWIAIFFRYWVGQGSNETLKIRRWPSIASLLFLLGSILLFSGAKDPITSLSEPGILSLSIMLVTILFALTSIWSLIVAYTMRNQNMIRLTYWSMTLLSSLHVLVTFYLSWYGVIGIMTWT